MLASSSRDEILPRVKKKDKETGPYLDLLAAAF
jgi:hypothetical protein